MVYQGLVKKIALVVAPCWTNFCPPLGTALLAAVLRRANHTVKCFDFNIESWHVVGQDNEYLWDFSSHHFWSNYEKYTTVVQPAIQLALDRYVSQLLAYDPELIGFSLYDTNLHASFYMINKIKLQNPQVKIICGGPYCQNAKNPHSMLISKHVALLDAIVVGEGEQAILRLVNDYNSDGEFSLCPGTLIKQNGILVDAGLSVDAVILNDLPFPDFSDFSIDNYRFNMLPMLTSRGCIAKCSFCGETIFFDKYRYRTAENIFQEIERSIVSYPQLESLAINDSLINGNIGELEKLADILVANNIKLAWGGYARVHKGLTPLLLKKIKKAGCAFLSYGIESGSQKVIDDMRKGFSIVTAEKNLQDTTAAGIRAEVNWIVGFPTETTWDFMKSLWFIFKNRANIARINPGQTPCGIPEGSVLDEHRDLFNISRDYYMGDWKTRDNKNTITIRRWRLTILVKFLDFLRMSHS